MPSTGPPARPTYGSAVPPGHTPPDAPESVREALRVRVLVVLTSIGLSAGTALLLRAAAGLAGG
jgi:hypothetical protein